MGIQHADHMQKKQANPRLTAEPEEWVVANTPYANGIVNLQGTIGNRGVQRLLAQGRLQQPRQASFPMIGLVQPTVQRCTCGCCNGEHEEQEEQPDTTPHQVQRFWGDDEESEDSSEGGGIVDWISDTAGSVADTVGSWFGGDEEESSDSEGDNWYSDDESDTEDSEDTENDWYTEESDYTDTVNEIPTVNVECDTDEAVGYGGGSGGSISLHGKTVANYNNGKPIPAPFPSTVTVTTSKVGDTPVFSASGSFDVNFKADLKITLPTVPSDLSECQKKAVKEFIDGPLTAHENEHAKAYTDNYDGKFTVKLNHKNIKDTPEMRQNAMETPVQNEDVKRANKANAASGKLDPWNKTIPGLDCDEESE